MKTQRRWRTTYSRTRLCKRSPNPDLMNVGGSKLLLIGVLKLPGLGRRLTGRTIPIVTWIRSPIPPPTPIPQGVHLPRLAAGLLELPLQIR